MKLKLLFLMTVCSQRLFISQRLDGVAGLMALVGLLVLGQLLA
jgi:hypothetical protein